MKRTKINFENINKGNYKIISPKKIMESRLRIKKYMHDFLIKMKLR